MPLAIRPKGLASLPPTRHRTSALITRSHRGRQSDRINRQLFVAAITGAAAGGRPLSLVPEVARAGWSPAGWANTAPLSTSCAETAFDATEEALKLGIVREVHPDDELVGGADAWCDRAALIPVRGGQLPLNGGARCSPGDPSASGCPRR